MSFTAILQKDYSLIQDKKANDLYSQGWYGHLTKKGFLKLDPYETILLMERKRIQVVDKNNKVFELAELVAYFAEIIPNFLVNYMLFKDLRGRGYVVKQHSAKETYFELYKRGSKPKKSEQLALVVPMIEGVQFNINELEKIVSKAKKIARQLLFAVIDSLGDVSYYSVSELEFKEINRKENEVVNEE